MADQQQPAGPRPIDPTGDGTGSQSSEDGQTRPPLAASLDSCYSANEFYCGLTPAATADSTGAADGDATLAAGCRCGGEECCCQASGAVCGGEECRCQASGAVCGGEECRCQASGAVCGGEECRCQASGAVGGGEEVDRSDPNSTVVGSAESLQDESESEKSGGDFAAAEPPVSDACAAGDQPEPELDTVGDQSEPEVVIAVAQPEPDVHTVDEQPEHILNSGVSKRRKTLDTKEVLGLAYRQAQEMRERAGDSGEDFTRFAVVGGRNSEPPSGPSSGSGSRSASTEPAGDELNRLNADQEREDEEATLAGRLRRPVSACSQRSDHSVQELELETTGDFPRDFQFPAPELAAGQGPSGAAAAAAAAAVPPSPAAEAGQEQQEQGRPRTLSVASRAARLLDKAAGLMFWRPGAGDGGQRRHRPRAHTFSPGCSRPASGAGPAPAGPAPDGGSPQGRPAPQQSTGRPNLSRRRSLDSGALQEATSRAELSRELLAPLRPIGGSDIDHSHISLQTEDVASDERSRKQLLKATEPPLIEHVVQSQESLASIAARFGSLPSEIVETNRLGSWLIFPGQHLFVPCRLPQEQETSGSGDAAPTGAEEKKNGASGRSASVRPRHWSSPGGSATEKDRISYVKIKSRLITDGHGVVAGTLLFTPNCLMFNPHVSDPLVVELGVDAYVVEVPVTYIVSAAYYADLANLELVRRQTPTPSGAVPPVEPANSAAQGLETQATEGDDANVAGDAQPATDPSHRSVCLSPHEPSETGDTAIGQTAAEDPAPTAGAEGGHSLSRASEGGAAPAAVSIDGAPPAAGAADGATVGAAAAAAEAEGGRPRSPVSDRSPCGPAEPVAVSLPVDIPAPTSPGSGEPDSCRETASAAARRRAWAGCHRPAGYSGPPPPSDADGGSPLSSVIPFFSSSVESQSSRGRSVSLRSEEDSRPTDGDGMARCPRSSASDTDQASADHQQPPESPKSRKTSGGEGCGEQRKLNRFKSIISAEEKPYLFMSCDELLQTSAPAAPKAPVFLRLVMGRPRGRRIPRSQRVLVCGQRRLPSQLCLAVPRDSCDRLHSFLSQWMPEICGGLDVTKPEERGYELISSDDDIWEPEEDKGTTGDTGDSKKVKGGPEAPRPGPPPPDMPVPDLIGRTDLLTDQAVASLSQLLPARVEGNPWTLVFSTSEHGFSLKSLYRKAYQHECPMLLLVQDADSHVFGALSTDPIRMRPHFYGTGESFLFIVQPRFCVFRWSGENQYFVRGSPEGLEFGCGDGRSGLYLDEGLYRGRTEPCTTYRNEPLTTNRDFLIHAVELWGLA